MFDISLAEVFVTFAVGAFLIGKKDLPKFANVAGTFVGRSVGMILRTKNEIFDATKDHKIHSVRLLSISSPNRRFDNPILDSSGISTRHRPIEQN